MKVPRLGKPDLNCVWVLLFALPAVLPLMQSGYLDSHDGLFHLYRLAALDDAFKAGVFYPRWFPDFAFGYGHAVLNYYSPLTYYVAEVFHLLGAGYVVSIKLTFAAAFLLSGLAMYLYAKEVLGRYPALIAAVVYTYFPYHLADTYLRGALAEAFAFVFLPLCLWAMHRVFTRGREVDVFLLALSFAGLMVTHHLTTLIFLPVLLLYLVLLWFLTRHHRAVPLALLSFAMAATLTAFYWLPVLTETRWVGLAAGLGSPGYERHLASLPGFFSLSPVYRYFPDLGGGVKNPFYPLGLIYVFIVLASLGVLIWLFLRPAGQRGSEAKRTMKRTTSYVLLFLGVTLASIFMMLTYSVPLWRLTQPLLAPLQYPWRFMALAALGLAFLSGCLFLPFERSEEGRTRWRLWRYGLGAGLLLVVSVYGLADLPIEPLPLEEEQVTVVRMWEEDFAARQIGATWTAEYVPIWVEADRSVVALPPPDLVPFETRDLSPEEIPQVVLEELRLLSWRMRVNSARGFPLRFHAFFFPGWRAYLDGQEAPVYPSGELALLTTDVPPGEHTIVVRFEDTTERLIGSMVTLLAALGLVGVAVFRGGRKAVIALLIGAILAGALVVWHVRPFRFVVTPQEKEVNLEDQVKLLGYSLDREAYRPGDTIHVTLYWLALQEMSQNYKVFVHFMDDGVTTMWAQHDGDPVEGFTPTTRWLAGEIVGDRHALYIPPDAPPGRYRLFTGMYEFETVRNLSILTPEAASPNNRILLQDVELVPR